MSSSSPRSRVSQAGLHETTAREELVRVLTSQQFAGSERLRSFLQFVSDRAIAGRVDEIKEYSIAIEVYGRDSSYDPRFDSVVRVEATRLRAKLREYYEGEGRNNPLRIRLPKGTYVPAFDPPADLPAGSRTSPSTPEAAPIAEPVVSSTAAGESLRPLWPRRRIAVGAILVIGVTAVLWYSRNSPPAATLRSIAVLPLVGLDGDANGKQLLDGLTEEITAQLATIPGLRVPGPGLMQPLRDQPLNLAELNRQFKVDAVLDGSLRQSADRIRISLRLLKVPDGYHLWAETLERTVADPLDLQKEIAATVFRAVRERQAGRFASDFEPSAAAREAFALYLRAQELRRDPAAPASSGPMPPNLLRAAELQERAVTLNPKFAYAWAGLAATYQDAVGFDQSRVQEFTRKSEEAANRAIQIDPNIPEAHGVLGFLDFFYNWDLSGAERHFLRAVELSPRESRFQRSYADVLRLTGRASQANTELGRAATLEPYAPRIRVQQALLLYDEQRYAEAMAKANEALALRQDDREAHWLIGLCHERQEQWREAEARYRHVLSIAPRDYRAIPALGYLLARQGRPEEARKVLATLEEAHSRGRSNGFSIALVYAGLGDRAKALDWLERGWQERDSSMIYLGVEPRFASLRNEPRFQRLLGGLRELGAAIPR